MSSSTAHAREKQGHDLGKTLELDGGDVAFLQGAWTPRQDFYTGKYLNGLWDKWKPSLDAVKATIRFLAATGRFTATSETLVT